MLRYIREKATKIGMRTAIVRTSIRAPVFATLGVDRQAIEATERSGCCARCR
jgi:hypothetical protein